MTPAELGLAGMELGAHVHALLRIDRTRAELDERGRLRTSPKVDRDHPLHRHLTDLTKYLRARCDRCAEQMPRTGLVLAYWGQWLCEACCEALGNLGGLLDLSEWPPRPVEFAA